MSSPQDTGKRVELDSLIMNLKKNLQTFSQEEKAPSVVVAPSVADMSIMAVDNVVATSSTSKPSFASSQNKYLCFFVNKAMFSTELFCFFFILLLCIRPSFLYYSEKIVQNRREMIKTRFSVLYLCIWSVVFTLMVHIMSYIQRKMSISFPYYS